MQLTEFDKIVEAAKAKSAAFKCNLYCCYSTGCVSSGCGDVVKAVQEALVSHGCDKVVRIVKTGCMGLCSHGPLMRVEVEGQKPVLYSEIRPLVARLIIAEHIVPALSLEKGADFNVPDFLSGFVLPLDIPFFSKQMKIVLANTGHIDPELIDDYLARGGYQALKKVLTEMTPQQVVEEVLTSGLRGRGGGGYPTGLKWKNAAPSQGAEKFVICNGDEGDPGAYMDRSVLEGDPQCVIEGMLIAAYAIGATSGWFYIRTEYPLAVDRVEKAIKQARKAGFLGKNIFGTKFSFDCDIRLGAGAFVCGEETALIASIEGRRGTPHPRPPYPSQKGLWGMPSCVNNVETLANVPHILMKGGAWYASIGTPESRGTKVFALTGKVKHSGLIEVPMGMTLRTIIEEIGGGPSTGKKIKAVQTGGPSGGVIPSEFLDTPVCYDQLKKLGSIMGSGGMIVLDEDDNMVDIAAFYLDFTADESCGQCSPCRIGGRQLLELLKKVKSGKGSMDDLALIKRLSLTMKKASLCGLGQTAPNPVLSTLKYFENEYLERIKN
ncbi:MAG: NADH dehydrogenase [Lentisphaerae bacterium GWF2_45_14]|nr:MAG: NADH dehydrogenase [Lentisphaerae bacterium GWF2_45_14]